MLCVSSSFPRDVDVVTKADLTVATAISERLEKQGFVADGNIPVSGMKGHFRAGQHKGLLGVEISASDDYRKLTVTELRFYPACKKWERYSFDPSIDDLLAGEKDPKYCRSLRTVLAYEDPQDSSDLESTAT